MKTKFEAKLGVSITVNAPEFFADEQFIQWLNNGEPKMTWHKGEQPNEWSDLVVLVDPDLEGEGSDSDMPEHIWDQIVAICREHVQPSIHAEHITVRLTNMAT